MIDDKWFKRAQRHAGVTAEDIAKKLGKDRSLVSRIYVGRQQMKLSEAAVFSEVLGVPLDEVLRRAGVADEPTAQRLAPGHSIGDAVRLAEQGADGQRARAIADAMGVRSGIELWQVRTAAMALQGLLPGDMLLVDTDAADRAKPGDVVVAQVHDNARGKAMMVLRRYEPPVLVAASLEPEDRRALIVDGINVVLRGLVSGSWRSPSVR